MECRAICDIFCGILMECCHFNEIHHLSKVEDTKLTLLAWYLSDAISYTIPCYQQQQLFSFSTEYTWLAFTYYVGIKHDVAKCLVMYGQLNENVYYYKLIKYLSTTSVYNLPLRK